MIGNGCTFKQKKITGTTPAEGALQTYATALTKNQIIGFQVIVSDSSGIWRLPNHGIQGTAPEYYFASILADGTLQINLANESTKVNGCSFVCILTYEA